MPLALTAVLLKVKRRFLVSPYAIILRMDCYQALSCVTQHRRYPAKCWVKSVVLSFASLCFFMSPACAVGPGLYPEQEQALRALARGERVSWPGLQPEQNQALSDAAESFLIHLQQYHLPQGLVADILWSDFSRSKVEKYEGIGDSTTWTGVYLAVLGLRWHVQRDPQTLQEIYSVLDRFDMLTRVSGRIGYLARYAGNAEDPAYQKYYRYYGGKESKDRPGFGVRAYQGQGIFSQMVWLGHSSRDTYDGACFGFSVLWKYVEENQVQQKIRELVERIGDRLVKDNWKILDGKGSHTWHSYRWRIAWTRLLLSVNPEKYAFLSASYHRMARRYPTSGPKIPSKYDKSYYPANLNFMRLFVLNLLEDDPERSARFRTAMRHLYRKKAQDHLNPYFAALYMAATGDILDENARATLEGMLCDYPELPKWSREVELQGFPENPMKNKHSVRYALLTRERILRDFLWQRPPCQVIGGNNKPIEYPTLDFLLPYWLGRASGVLKAP